MQIIIDPNDLNEAQIKWLSTFPKSAQSSAGASQSTIAHVVTQAATLEDSELLPGAAFSENEAATAAQSTESPAGLDSNGLPWDARIHSSSKERNKDGSWRIRRNISPELVETVTDQLRGIHKTPVPAKVAEMLAPLPPVAAQLSFPMVVKTINEAKVAGKLTEAQVTEILQALGVNTLPILALRPELFQQAIDMIGAYTA